MCLMGFYQCRLFYLGILWNWYIAWRHCLVCLCLFNKWMIDWFKSFKLLKLGIWRLWQCVALHRETKPANTADHLRCHIIVVQTQLVLCGRKCQLWSEISTAIPEFSEVGGAVWDSYVHRVHRDWSAAGDCVFCVRIGCQRQRWAELA